MRIEPFLPNPDAVVPTLTEWLIATDPASIFTDPFTTTLDEELMVEYTERHIPADTNGGWPFAGAVIVFALVCIATVTYVHKQTYRHPTDVTWHGKGSGDAPAKGH